METLDTAGRFFGSFNFLTPANNLRPASNSLSFQAFWPSTNPWHRLCIKHHHSETNTENMNQLNGTLPEVGSRDFQKQVLESPQPVLVLFWTPWSRPCQIFDSVLQDISRTCAGKFKVVKVNADDHLDLSICYDIHSIPTLLQFVRGNPCFRIVGTASKEAILAKLQPFTQ